MNKKAIASIAILLLGALILGLCLSAGHETAHSKTATNVVAVADSAARGLGTIQKPSVPSAGAPHTQAADQQSMDVAYQVWHKTLECYQANETIGAIQKSLENSNASNMTSAEARAADWKLARQQQRLARAQKERESCNGLDEQNVADELYPALLRLAKLGDSRASACYVAAPFIPTESGKGQEVVASYKANAWDLINRGIANGDWRTIRLLESLYARSRQTVGLFPTLAESDEFMAYKYRLVRRLGTTGEYGSQVDRQLAGQRQYLREKMNLDADDFAAADQWAEDLFRKNFSNSPPLQGDPPPCGNPNLAPSAR